MDNRTWDFVIVGSGFGASASALRLVEKGYRVLMFEKGRRFTQNDFARTNWDLRRWLWLPLLGCRGIFKMTFLRHLTALSGVGVGGGSLVYANTLPIPSDSFFASPAWSHLADWRAELVPHYATARRMMGATRNPNLTVADEFLREVARDLGREQYVEPTDVAVFFGEPEVTVPDPYFGGAGPSRAGCDQCGGCMVGCRFNAKNTLDKNYLYLAEKRGLEIRADTEVTWVLPAAGGGYEIETRHGSLFSRQRLVVRTDRVIFAGGVLGTVPLLAKLKASADGLPKLSDRLGEQVRTNSEVLMGVVTKRRDIDLSKGIAITSIFRTDEHSHLEPVRYSAGSGFFRLLLAPHAPGRTLLARLLAALLYTLRHPWQWLGTLAVPDFARFTTILLYMRSAEGVLRLQLGRSVRTGFRRGLVSGLTTGQAPRAAIPEATDLASRFAQKSTGVLASLVTELVWGTPTTAHILGGCVMGATAREGVINSRHEVFGYSGLYVIDGSAVSANPGVNPSLTILALAERAMTFIEPSSGR